MRLLRTLTEPRTLLIVMMILGGAFLAYVILAASVPKSRPWEEGAETDRGPLLTGEVEGFRPADVPRGLPPVTVTKAGGDEAELRALAGRGEVVVLNLWASWCAPCLEELPSLVAMAERTGVTLLPIAVERPSDAQTALLEKAGVAGAFPLWSDPSLSLLGAFGGDLGLPLTAIYDVRGREVGRLEGAADWAAPEALRLIEAIRDGEAKF
ncbi:TlpA family protein disulfide reductase [Parvularcula dongshanensis]|uniref:Thiol-disulfide isomerase/thioredoxin n=1 Tax=Parvularcula dongshanensis TaxID=1173995 RepID=A0A840I1Z8_9PROT|nr:TlpA disulfide reductase family protein [Parvularcula dongshanensis]MBB4658311.1 thiol-disulfide isomerase/thioredoxin [Parvularcula dongshanensis]